MDINEVLKEFKKNFEATPKEKRERSLLKCGFVKKPDRVMGISAEQIEKCREMDRRDDEILSATFPKQDNRFSRRLNGGQMQRIMHKQFEGCKGIKFVEAPQPTAQSMEDLDNKIGSQIKDNENMRYRSFVEADRLVK